MCSCRRKATKIVPYGVRDRRFRAKGKQLKTLEGLEPQRQGQNLALTVLRLPYSLDSGLGEIAPEAIARQLWRVALRTRRQKAVHLNEAANLYHSVEKNGPSRRFPRKLQTLSSKMRPILGGGRTRSSHPLAGARGTATPPAKSGPSKRSGLSK